MCMDESPEVTLYEIYAPTVNESETITDAQKDDCGGSMILI